MRYGAVIKFRPGTTETQIAKALNTIKDVLDVPTESLEPVYQIETSESPFRGTAQARMVRYKTVPFRWGHLVQKYDPKHGEPVWYIP